MFCKVFFYKVPDTSKYRWMDGRAGWMVGRPNDGWPYRLGRKIFQVIWMYGQIMVVRTESGENFLRLFGWMAKSWLFVQTREKIFLRLFEWTGK